MAKERKSQFNIEELTAPNHGMKRDMGFFRAVGLMAGLMIGSGIFYVGALSLIHISEPTRQAEISYAVFCLKKKKQKDINEQNLLVNNLSNNHNK